MISKDWSRWSLLENTPALLRSSEAEFLLCSFGKISGAEVHRRARKLWWLVLQRWLSRIEDDWETDGGDWLVIGAVEARLIVGE
ncbi:hypothetical protein F2Q69_00033968 [Brassica cretica]|uniref:Uncharacterized protein n=1 Tax=Brassica cretica TaxID=69181 RepID=A0A8S9SCX1_BRACR|nr:hypothetical protein F2Q69_00033968 [Brassica cretica]